MAVKGYAVLLKRVDGLFPLCHNFIHLFLVVLKGKIKFAFHRRAQRLVIRL